MHAARACATAGCHLLIEKPLAAAADGIPELAALAARSGLGISVAYQLRFHPAIVRMRELVCGGLIGRVLSMRAEYGQYLPAWRPARDYRETYTAQSAQGGGILLDASHEIDYVRWIAGEVRSVFATLGRLSALEMDAEDTAALVLRLDGPALAEIHLDCVRRGYARGCAIVGSEGTVQWDSQTGLRITAADGSVREEAIVPDPNAAYVAELDAFLKRPDAAPPMASLADGRRVLDIVLAARRVVGGAARDQPVRIVAIVQARMGSARLPGQDARGYRRTAGARPRARACGRHHAARRSHPGDSGDRLRTMRSRRSAALRRSCDQRRSRRRAQSILDGGCGLRRRRSRPHHRRLSAARPGNRLARRPAISRGRRGLRLEHAAADVSRRLRHRGHVRSVARVGLARSGRPLRAGARDAVHLAPARSIPRGECRRRDRSIVVIRLTLDTTGRSRTNPAIWDRLGTNPAFGLDEVVSLLDDDPELLADVSIPIPGRGSSDR